MASECFPLLTPDYGTDSPLKFELVLMFKFFKSKLKWVMCKLVINDILMFFFTL